MIFSYYRRLSWSSVAVAAYYLEEMNIYEIQKTFPHICSSENLLDIFICNAINDRCKIRS